MSTATFNGGGVVFLVPSHDDLCSGGWTVRSHPETPMDQRLFVRCPDCGCVHWRDLSFSFRLICGCGFDRNVRLISVEASA